MLLSFTMLPISIIMEFGEDFWRFYNFVSRLYWVILDSFGRFLLWFFPISFLLAPTGLEVFFLAFLVGLFQEVVFRFREDGLVSLWVFLFLFSFILLFVNGWPSSVFSSFGIWIVGSLFWSFFSFYLAHRFPAIWRYGFVSFSQKDLEDLGKALTGAIRVDIAKKFGVSAAVGSVISLSYQIREDKNKGKVDTRISWRANVRYQGRSLEGPWMSIDRHWRDRVGHMVFIDDIFSDRLAFSSEGQSAHSVLESIHDLDISRESVFLQEMTRFAQEKRVYFSLFEKSRVLGGVPYK